VKAQRIEQTTIENKYLKTFAALRLSVQNLTCADAPVVAQTPGNPKTAGLNFYSNFINHPENTSILNSDS